METSVLTLWRIGIVAKDKLPKQNMIEVYPQEEFFLVNGDVTEKTQLDVETKTIDDKHRSVNINRSVTIVAKWIDLNGGNRITSPDVTVGMTVILFKVGSTEEYRWSTLGYEADLAKLEHVEYLFSNKPKRDDGKSTKFYTTSYTFIVSTLKKFIRLKTVNNDGEAAKYDIELDTKAGHFTFTDNFKNSIHLNSVKGWLNTAINEMISIITKVFKLTVTDDMVISVGKNFNTHASDKINSTARVHTITASEEVNVTSPGKINVVATKLVNITGSDVLLNGNKIKVTSAEKMELGGTGIEIRSKDLNIVNDNTNDNFIILLTECLYKILNEKRFDSLNGLTHLEPGYKSDVEEIIKKIKNFKKG